MPEEYYPYRAEIPLKHQNIFDIEGATLEILTIKDWLDKLTDWRPDMYSTRLRMSPRQLDVWFKDERHYLICLLTWQ